MAQEALEVQEAGTPEPQGKLQLSLGTKGRYAGPRNLLPTAWYLEEGSVIHLLQEVPDPAVRASHSLQVALQSLLLTLGLCQRLCLGHLNVPQRQGPTHLQGLQQAAELARDHGGQGAGGALGARGVAQEEPRVARALTQLPTGLRGGNVGSQHPWNLSPLHSTSLPDARKHFQGSSHLLPSVPGTNWLSEGHNMKTCWG